jgi:uncharacterized protein YecE (DUF72 family)
MAEWKENHASVSSVNKREGAMIYIGLAGWGDHPSLYPAGVKPSDKLAVYSTHFPIVEVDSSFYAVQPASRYAKWASDTPGSFGFVVKAYQRLTGHDRRAGAGAPDGEPDDAFRLFRESLAPLRESGKLRAVLFQYPPWFDCTREHVDALRRARERMGDFPVALEFRHRSWFTGAMRERTLAFMRQEGWMHSICDEPQAGAGSVPTVLVPTHPGGTIVRFHGRNRAGWNRSAGQGNWRDVRYLYRYSEQELAEWAAQLRELQRSTEHIYVIFNNNSGGDAADNAKQLIRLLGLEYEGLGPQQLNLF